MTVGRKAMRSVLIFVAVSLVLTSCAGINIQTGPPSDEEATAVSERRASDLRQEYYRKLADVTAVEKARILTDFANETLDRLNSIGYNVLDSWVELERSRGSQVSADYMRQSIEQSLKTDMPMLDAYQDVVDFAMGEIKSTRFFGEEMLSLLRELQLLYDKTISDVLYPNVDQKNYQLQLQEAQDHKRDLIERINEVLQTYWQS